jgi:polyhydroxyalkanoate synthase
MLAPLGHAQVAWLTHPQELAELGAKFSGDLMAFTWHAWNRALGLPSEDPILPHADDTRFADPVWKDSATWDIVKEWYLLLTHNVQDALYDTPALSGKERRRAAFWWRKWLNAMAPTNFLLTNPVAMAKAAETNGESLVRGMHNFLEDLKAGNVRMTRPEDFTVGKNLATTPGAVVFRNRLLEVIHYAPTTEKVHAMPIVIVTPWINKFYILDLNPKKSLVKYLTRAGLLGVHHQLEEPDAGDARRELRGLHRRRRRCGHRGGARLLRRRAGACRRLLHRRHGAVDLDGLGQPQIRRARQGAGGALDAIHHPGGFPQAGRHRSLHRRGQRALADPVDAGQGFPRRQGDGLAFRLLRSNSLIWHYVVHGYLYGEAPPPFDVLYWNMDTTLQLRAGREALRALPAHGPASGAAES